MKSPIPIVMLAILLIASCAGTPTPGASQEPSAWDGTPVVTTRFGAVRGFEDADATWVWKAVPFALPPVGELRWKAPRDPVPWTGVREERSFHDGCTQFSAVWKGQATGGEDCLYLNVWRPRDAEADLPVYVWIHGGGNSIGSAASNSKSPLARTLGEMITAS